MYVGTYKCTFFDLNFWLFINPRHTNAQKTYLISFNEFSSCSQPDLVSNDLIVNSSVLPGRLCGVVKKINTEHQRYEQKIHIHIDFELWWTFCYCCAKVVVIIVAFSLRLCTVLASQSKEMQNELRTKFNHFDDAFVCDEHVDVTKSQPISTEHELWRAVT